MGWHRIAAMSNKAQDAHGHVHGVQLAPRQYLVRGVCDSCNSTNAAQLKGVCGGASSCMLHRVAVAGSWPDATGAELQACCNTHRPDPCCFPPSATLQNVWRTPITDASVAGGSTVMSTTLTKAAAADSQSTQSTQSMPAQQGAQQVTLPSDVTAGNSASQGNMVSLMSPMAFLNVTDDSTATGDSSNDTSSSSEITSSSDTGPNANDAAATSPGTASPADASPDQQAGDTTKAVPDRTGTEQIDGLPAGNAADSAPCGEEGATLSKPFAYLTGGGECRFKSSCAGIGFDRSISASVVALFCVASGPGVSHAHMGCKCRRLCVGCVWSGTDRQSLPSNELATTRTAFVPSHITHLPFPALPCPSPTVLPPFLTLSLHLPHFPFTRDPAVVTDRWSSMPAASLTRATMRGTSKFRTIRLQQQQQRQSAGTGRRLIDSSSSSSSAAPASTAVTDQLDSGWDAFSAGALGASSQVPLGSALAVGRAPNGGRVFALHAVSGAVVGYTLDPESGKLLKPQAARCGVGGQGAGACGHRGPSPRLRI